MKTLNSVQEYMSARESLNQYEIAATKWMKENKTNGIPVEITKTFPFADIVDNDLRSAIEVYEFVNNPPDKYFLYINEDTCRATTFMGQELGKVSFGHEFRDNFGGKRIPITLTAINGLVYHGIYFKSAGDYAHIKLAKYRFEKEYEVIGHYPQGKEVVTTETTWNECRERLKEYRENEPQTVFSFKYKRIKVPQKAVTINSPDSTDLQINTEAINQ